MHSEPQASTSLIPRKEWNNEEREVLRQYVKDGYSLKQIGNILGRTRNAISGEKHRLGLSVPPKPQTPQPEKRVNTSTHRSRPRLKVNHFGEVSKLPPPKPRHRPRPTLQSQQCSLADLNGHTCRWPLGDYGAISEFYCGAPPLTGYSYCVCHCKQAYSEFRVPRS